MSGIGNQKILSDEEYSDTVGCLSKLKVPQIKDIARCLSLPLSGKKQDLIDRVVAYCEQGRRFNDNIRLLAVRTIVLKVRNNDPIPNFTALYDALRTGAFNFVEGISQYSDYKKQIQPSHSKTSNESHPYKGHVLYFKESPFYKLKRLVHGSPQIAIPSKMKAVCRYQFILNEEENKLIKLGNENLRFYILCGISSNSTASTSSALLEFPIPVELHVNGTHIKENVRGIKGKPGTARPANVTSYILPDQQLNKIEMAYAGTTESFLLYLYIVEYVSCEKIIETILHQPHVHRNATILQIQKEYSNDEGDDDDIIVSTSSISLKCPLTYARMKYPTKSIFCQHIQCFDGLSYLQLQEQVPSWICPVCSNKIDISHLAISDYYCDILEKTSEEIENVTLKEDGTWEVVSDNSHNGNNGSSKSKIDSYDDNGFTLKKSPQSRLASEEIHDHASSAQSEIIEIISLDSDSDDEVVAGDTTMQNASNSQDNTEKASHSHNMEQLNEGSIVPNQTEENSHEHELNHDPRRFSTNSASNSNAIENSLNVYNVVDNHSHLNISLDRQISDHSSATPNRTTNVSQSPDQTSEVKDTQVTSTTNRQIRAPLLQNINTVRHTLPPLVSQSEYLAGSDYAAKAPTLPLLSRATDNHSLGESQSAIYPLHNSFQELNSLQRPDSLPNIPRLENPMRPQNINGTQLHQLPIPSVNQVLNLPDLSSKNLGPEHNSGPSDGSQSNSRNSGRKSPPIFFSRDSLANIYQPQPTFRREPTEPIGDINLNYRINHTLPVHDTGTDSTIASDNGNGHGPRQKGNDAQIQPNDSSGNLTNVLQDDQVQPLVDRIDSSHVPKETNALRYSQSAFDLVNKNLPRNGAAERSNGELGLLGISLSEDAMHMEEASSQPQQTEMTPLKGKIYNMNLGASSDKKRSLSGSGSATGRTWNKRLNSTVNTDSLETAKYGSDEPDGT